MPLQVLHARLSEYLRYLHDMLLTPLLVQDERQVYEASTRKSPEEGAATTLENDTAAEPDGGTDTPFTTETVINRPSPLSVPLTSSLEDLRRERRRSMSHSTRIRVEALTGDRELDLEGIRMVVSRVDARRENIGLSEATSTLDSNPGASPPCSTQLLRNLEAECSALLVVDWAAAAEFSFSRELRKPDQRWTEACNKLEGQIAVWLERRRGALAAGRSGRGRGGLAARDGRGYPAAAITAIPPTEEDRVWQALDAFQLEAGDVVDDRHSSTEAVMEEIGNEADRRMRAWRRNIESAAAGLCAAERATHVETVGALRVLDRLFGLENDESTGSADLLREATCAAVDAVWKELSVALDERLYPSEGGALKEELRRAVQEVYEGCSATSTDPIRKLTLLPALASEYQPEASLSQRYQDVDDGLVRRHDIGEASNHIRSSVTTPTAGAEVDAGSQQCDKDEEKGALTNAVWRCRQTYICRLRGVVMRILRAVERCEAKVSSMQAALRRLKRHRVQVEHEGISAGTATVRRALEDCDFTAIADILENGIPVGHYDRQRDSQCGDPLGISASSVRPSKPESASAQSRTILSCT